MENLQVHYSCSMTSRQMLCPGKSDDEMVAIPISMLLTNLLAAIRLALLRLETSSLFEVMSKAFPDTKSRHIFLINTFDLVLTLLSVSRFEVASAECSAK